MTAPPLPRLAMLVLKAAPAEWRESIAGDLEEERARRLSRGQRAGALWALGAASSVTLRLTADRLFGPSTPEHPHEGRTIMDAVSNDVRQATRRLLRSRGFAAAAVLTLALGIGANAAVFTAAWHVLLKPLPWPEADRLVQIWNTSLKTGDINVLSPANYLDLERDVQSLDAIAAYTYFNYSLNLTGVGEPLEARVRAVTGHYFRVFGTPPRIGRVLTADDARDNAAVIVISEGLWERRFGGDADVLGRRIDLDERAYEVVGVMPASFDPSGRPLDGWVPYHFTPEIAARRLGFFLAAVGRTRAGVTVDQARSEIAAIAASAADRHPTTNATIGATARGLREEMSGSLRTGITLLLASAALVLVIACTNLTSLHIVRAGGMGRELAIRAAVGATRLQIVRLLLVEAAIVSIVAGATGLLAGVWAVSAIVAAAPPSIVAAGPPSLDPLVAIATLGMSVVSGLLVASLAAFGATRTSDVDALRSRSASDRSRGRLRSALVTTEVALATTLVIVALTLVVSFGNVMRVELGFNPDRVYAADLRLPGGRYETPERQAQFFEDVLESLRARGSVERACATNTIPLEQAGTMTYVPDGTERLVTALPVTVTRDCFATLGIALRAGRLFAAREPEPVAIVSDSYARRAFGAESAVGKMIRVGLPTGERLTIVGVVADSRRVSLERESFGQVYEPVHQSRYFSAARILVRSSAPIDRLAGDVNAAVRGVDDRQPVGNLRSLDEVIERSLGSRRFNLMLLGGFAAIALLLAAVGVYGLLAQMVTGRRAEIGVRMALGASRGGIVRLVTGGALISVGVGVTLGLSGAWLAARAVSGFVFGVSPTDPRLYAGAAGLLVLLAAIASAVPVRRATRVDPIAVLRAE